MPRKQTTKRLNEVLQLLAGQELPQVLHDQLLGTLWPATGRMWAENKIRRLPELAWLRKRLCLEHIKGGTTDPLLYKSIVEGILINGGATSDVDDPRVLGEELQPLGVESMLRGWVAGEDHDKSVGLW